MTNSVTALSTNHRGTAEKHCYATTFPYKRGTTVSKTQLSPQLPPQMMASTEDQAPDELSSQEPRDDVRENPTEEEVNEPEETSRPPEIAKISLVNARSLSNKTFILKDFFMSHNLDFLFLTETWMNVGDTSAFCELVPPDCRYFNSPRESGCGGGVATVCKKKYDCIQLSETDNYSSFEMNLVELRSDPPMLYAVIYRPPGYNKDFISDFWKFLVKFVEKYDQILLVGDFNIHVDHPRNRLDNDFLRVIKHFKFKLCKYGATHERGRTLDLVLTHGFTIYNLVIFNSFFSDHNPVVCEIPLPPGAVKQSSSVSRMVSLSEPSIEELCSDFISICQKILNHPNPEPQSPRLRASSECEKCLHSINNIRSTRAPPLYDPPTADAVLNQFKPVSLSFLKQVIDELRPTVSLYDPMPLCLFKKKSPELAPYVLKIINASFKSGVVPVGFKHGAVSTERPALPCSEHANFCALILEKIVYNQLKSFLQNVSAGSEIRVMVFNDVLLARDSGPTVALVKFDLTSAFDSVDHKVLLSRLKNWAGIQGLALEWFRSYLAYTAFSEQSSDAVSSSGPLTCGLPQGSVLGPLLLLLYMRPLKSILKKHNGSPIIYQKQYYVLLKHPKSLPEILDEFKEWMAQNFLSFNDEKTEIVFPLSDSANMDPVDRDSLEQVLKPAVRFLGVEIDSDFKLDAHISEVVESGCLQLEQLAKVKPMVTGPAFKNVIQAFLTTHLESHYALYTELSPDLIEQLQSLQDSAAHLLISLCKDNNISAICKSLEWLPVRFGIKFKILVLVFKCLKNLAPKYLSDLLQPSADPLLLVVPEITSEIGKCAFSVAGPKLWNELPFYIRKASSICEFECYLKEHFLSLAFN